MKNYLDTFEQPALRGWLWLILIMVSVLMAFLCIFVQNYKEMFDNIFFALAIYWIDKIEKELTFRNQQKKKEKKGFHEY